MVSDHEIFIAQRANILRVVNQNETVLQGRRLREDLLENRVGVVGGFVIDNDEFVVGVVLALDRVEELLVQFVAKHVPPS